MSGFSSEVFDCMKDKKLCLVGICCTPCLNMRTSRMIFGAPTCNCFDCCSGMVTPYVQRQILRAHLQMEQKPATDCLLSLFCMPCVVCQVHRELDYLGIPRTSFECCGDTMLTCIPPLKAQAPNVPAEN